MGWARLSLADPHATLWGVTLADVMARAACDSARAVVEQGELRPQHWRGTRINKSLCTPACALITDSAVHWRSDLGLARPRGATPTHSATEQTPRAPAGADRPWDPRPGTGARRISARRCANYRANRPGHPPAPVPREPDRGERRAQS